MKKVQTTKAPAAIGPYSQAIVVNNMVYTSGQIPFRADGSLEDDPKLATNIIFKNIENILLEAGSSLNKVCKVNVYVTNISHFGIINEEYAKYFSDPFPARSLVEVSNLPKNAIMEIEVIATL